LATLGISYCYSYNEAEFYVGEKLFGDIEQVVSLSKHMVDQAFENAEKTLKDLLKTGEEIQLLIGEFEEV
jgi:nucleoid DNA-binding protein